MMENRGQELKTMGEERKTFEQQLIKEAERLYGEVERLKKENLRIQQASTNQTSKVSNMERDVEILTKDRNDLLERVENLSKKLSQATREKKILEDEIRENISNTSTVQSNTEVMQLRIKIMEKDEKIKDLIAKNDKLCRERDEIFELIEKQQLIAQNKESGVFELQETMENLTDELKQLKQNHKQKISDLEKLLHKESEDSDKKIKRISEVHGKELVKKENKFEKLKTTFSDFKKATKALGLKVEKDHKNEIQALKKSHCEKIKQLRLEFSQSGQSELGNEHLSCEENGRNIVSTVEPQTKLVAMLSDQDIEKETSTKSNEKIQNSDGTTRGRKRGATRGRKKGGGGKKTGIPALSPIAEESSIEDVEEGVLPSKSSGNWSEIQTETSEPPKKKTMQIKESETLEERDNPKQVSEANKKQIKSRKKQTKEDKEIVSKTGESVPTRTRKTRKKANTDISSKNSTEISKQQPSTSDAIEKTSKAAEPFLKNDADEATLQFLDKVSVEIPTENFSKKAKKPPNKQENRRRRPLKQDPIENSIAPKNQPRKKGSQKSKQDPIDDSIAKQEMSVCLPAAGVPLETQSSSSTRRLRKRK